MSVETLPSKFIHTIVIVRMIVENVSPKKNFPGERLFKPSLSPYLFDEEHIMHRNSPYQNQPPSTRQRALHRVVDEQHQGMVVSTFAYPSEWQARSEVVWNAQHTNLPALVYAVAFNPNGMESFEFLPTQAFFWLEGEYGNVPIGQNSHGLVRMPPRPAPDALANLVIPHFRGDRQQLRVTGVQPVPNLWQLFNAPPPQQGESLMARVEYEENGRAVEEEFYGIYEWVPTQSGALNWGFGRLFCFRAERGQLDDAMRQTFWQIAGSLQPNPQWMQVYEQVLRQSAARFDTHIGNIHAKFQMENEMGRRNIAYNDQLIEQRNRQVADTVERQRQANQERSQYSYTRQEAFGDALVHQTAFHDPNSPEGNYHYEQGTPAYTYTDGQGGWYSTDDPTDNPNDRSSRTWVPAQQVKPNG